MRSHHIDVLFDERYSIRRENFEETLYHIQDRHFEWFSKRINPVTGEYPDKIYNYYRYYYNEADEIALFLKDDLDPKIRYQCMAAFNKIFN